MPLTPSAPKVAARLGVTEPGASVGIFLALLAGTAVFSHSSTPLLRYPDRAIGVGLLHGVDPARRFAIYLTLVAVMLGVWLACHYGFRFLRSWRPSWFSGVRARLENDLCSLFATVGSVALVARVSADRLDRLGPTMMCLTALGITVGLALVRRLSPKVHWFPRRLGSLSSLAIVVLLAWPASQIAGVLGNVQDASGAWLVRVGTVLLPLLYALALGHFVRYPGKARRADVSRAFALAAAPFFAFPALCPVANEVQLTLARRQVVEPRSVALVFLAVLAGASAILFWRARAGKLRLSSGRLLARYVFPTVIFGEALLSVYKHTIEIRRVDPLHDGEQITAIQQLLAFDKWPFVDVWPAHGLFDYLGALYSLVNGFRPLEITAWNGLLTALAATAVYAILANISTPLFAFAVAALLPIEAILPLPVYSFFYAEPGLLAVGLLACVVLARPVLWRYALLSLVACLCFFWTPTSGVASILAVLGLLVLGSLTTNDRRPAWRGLAVFAATGVGVFIIYVLVLVLRGQPVFDTLGLIRAYMQADPLIGGRPSIIDRFEATEFVQYLLLPGIGVLYLAKLARHALERRPLDNVDRLLGFLTLVSFVLFARTLTRHGIVERYQPFYFVLLALCAWMPRRSRESFTPLGATAAFDAPRGELAVHFWQRAGARAVFCVGFALYLVWLPHPSYKHLVFNAFPFHTWQPNESRVQGRAPKYSELRALLRTTLGPQDTFLEMLNMPVLYGLLEREMPGQFFLPTMFYATDSVQKSYLARLEAFGGSARVPVVLLPNDKGNIDNIENTLRSYRIAEHIYRNYVPFVRVDGFDAWISRARWDEAAQKVSPLPLSFRDPSGYRIHSVNPPRLEAGVLYISAKGTDPRVEDVAEVQGVPLGGIATHHAVRFEYRSSVTGDLELFCRFAGGNYNATDSARTRLRATQAGEWQVAEMAVPTKVDPKVALRALRIDPPDGADIELKNLTLVFGPPKVPDPELYVAGMLPFFWGNFDEHHAARDASVVHALDVPQGNPSQSAFDLQLRPVLDKSTGNYLKLCFRLPASAAPPTSSRWKSIRHGGSWESAGKVTLSYGAAPPSTFVFDLVQPTPGAPGLPEALVRSFAEECKPYLVRVSAQYVWNSQTVSSIKVSSSVPVVLESASVLAGD